MVDDDGRTPEHGYTISSPVSELKILEYHIIPVVSITLDIDLFTFLSTFIYSLLLYFFEKKNFHHILECNLNLFIK